MNIQPYREVNNSQDFEKKNIHFQNALQTATYLAWAGI
jgi:hypothetical protein